MSSFATDVDVAQKTLCGRDSIKKAVKNLDRALQHSASQPGAGDRQLALALDRDKAERARERQS